MNKFIDNFIEPHKRGDTWDGIEIEYFEYAPDGITKIPTNLTGVTVLCQFKGNANGFYVFFDFKTSDGTVTIPNPLNGKIILMPKEINVSAAVYSTDVQLTFPSGRVESNLAGSWKIYDDISR
jgi:hypothetical protein